MLRHFFEQDAHAERAHATATVFFWCGKRPQMCGFGFRGDAVIIAFAQIFCIGVDPLFGSNHLVMNNAAYLVAQQREFWRHHKSGKGIHRKPQCETLGNECWAKGRKGEKAKRYEDKEVSVFPFTHSPSPFFPTAFSLRPLASFT